MTDKRMIDDSVMVVITWSYLDAGYNAHFPVQLYVVLVLTLPSHSQALGEGRGSEDTGLLTGAEEGSGPGDTAPDSSNALLGSVIKLGGGILGIAGKIGESANFNYLTNRDPQCRQLLQ